MARSGTRQSRRPQTAQARQRARSVNRQASSFAIGTIVSPSCGSPPDHLPIGRAANDGPAPFDAIGRLNPNGPDAAGVDRKVVVERRRTEVATKAAEIAEIRTAAGERIEASVRRPDGIGRPAARQRLQRKRSWLRATYPDPCNIAFRRHSFQ